MNIRDLFEKTVSVGLPDGSTVTFARMTIRDWSKISARIREDRIKAELAAIAGENCDAMMKQTLRIRATLFEPSYFDLLDYAKTPDGLVRVLPYAAEKGGTPKEVADQIPDLIQPSQVDALIAEIVHAPTGARVGGNVNGGQSPSPTDAGSSQSATGSNDGKHGSESPSESTGNATPPESAPSTTSTSAT